METAIELTGLILILGAAVWIGDLISCSLEEVLGEKTARQRALDGE